MKEYKDIKDDEFSKRTILASGMGSFNRNYDLVHKTAGYECAGSCARYTNESWGAIATNRDGTTSGQWYKTETEAREHFERVTTPIVEIA